MVVVANFSVHECDQQLCRARLHICSALFTLCYAAGAGLCSCSLCRGSLQAPDVHVGLIDHSSPFVNPD